MLKASKVKVWDWTLRLVHWSFPVLMFLLWFSQKEGHLDRHILLAQILTGLILYRIIWGFIGTPYAKFSHFLYCPKKILAYAKAFFSGKKPFYLGHNPLGALMVYGLLLAMGLQLFSGLFVTDEFLYEGPYYNLVERSFSGQMAYIHQNFFNVLLAFIALHVLAVLAYRFMGENLIKPMLTGNKEVPSNSPAAEDQQAALASFPWVRFVIAAGLAAVITWLIFNPSFFL